MTYVIVKREGETEPGILHCADKQKALLVVKNIVDGLYHTLNPLNLSISKKEDDHIVRYDDNLVAVIEIREDDEVDVSPTNGQ